MNRILLSAIFVGLTATCNAHAMGSIADVAIIDHPTPGSLSPRTNLDLIDGAFMGTIDDFRSAYTLRYALGASTPGWHDVTVTVRGHKDYVVRTRTGYRID